MNSQTQSLIISGAAGAIDVRIDQPAVAAPVRGTAIIAHPHPLHGGTLDNKVVQTLARAHVQMGWRTVRFNFRGVGQSAGVFDQGSGETDDWLQVIAHFAPEGEVALAGFSFGAFITAQGLSRVWGQRAADIASVVLVGTAASRFAVPALPVESHAKVLVVHGEVDDTVPLSSVMDWARPQALPVTVIPAVEHFFHGKLPLLKDLTLRHLAGGSYLWCANNRTASQNG